MHTQNDDTLLRKIIPLQPNICRLFING